MPAVHRASAVVSAALNRPRLWRVTTMLGGLLLCLLLLLASQGSLDIVSQMPAATTGSAAAAPRWVRWCSSGAARQDRVQLAFCARVDGRVLWTTHGPAPQEVHVAVISDFHLVIVRVSNGSAAPSLGDRIVAVGPLLRARDGQREIQAFRMSTG